MADDWSCETVAAMTIRNLPEETLRALRHRAAANRRSTAAEVRAILEEAVRPENQLKLGSALVEAFRPLGGAELEISRDKTPARRRLRMIPIDTAC
jgi:plasmid stability protein